MKSAFYFVMVFALLVGIAPVAQSVENMGMTEQDPSLTVPVTAVSGIVKEAQGDWVIIQDLEGTEWRIQVDKYTQTIGHVLPGVMITAMVEADGHAKEVKVLSNS